MKLTLTLQTDEAIALRRLANELGGDLDAAAQIALRDWLIGQGLLELPDEPDVLDEDTETVGEA